MKINLMNFVLGLLILLIGFYSPITQGQNHPQAPNAVSSISIAPNVSGLAIGDIIHVPIRITTATGPNQPIASAGIFIDYSQSVLYPLGLDGYTPTFGGIFTYNPFYSTNRLYFSWESSSSNNVAFANVQIATLDFIYIGGTNTTMHLRHSPDVGNLCSFVSTTGNVVISSFTDNTISGVASGTYDIHSVATGGPFNWNDQSAWVEGVTPTSVANVFITGEEMQIFTQDPNFSFIPKCNNLTINPAGQLTVNAGFTFTVNGNMLIQSDATGTGSFVDFGTTNVLGSTNVELAMAGNWVFGNTSYQSHLVSSPVANQSNAIFTGSLMNKWNEVTQNWDSLALPFITMGLGTGYAVSPASPGITATFSGNLNTGDKTITGLTNTGSAAYSGYNLVGNPFPSSINWNTNVSLTAVNPTAWVWNGAGAYIASTQTIGGVIAPEQGFFVQATGSGSITIPNSERFHGATFYKSSATDLLTLKVEGNNYWDQTQVHVNSLATAGYESQFDAHKMIGGYDAPQIYSMLPDEQLSINSLPSLNGSPAIQLGFLAGSTNTFTITASDMETFTSNTEFYLEDLVANKVQNLKTNPVYSFTASSGQQEHRFNLHFSPVGIHDGTTADGMKIYSSEKTVYVNISSELKGTIVVYDLTGREVSRTGIQSLTLNRINLNVPTGFYLVKVEGDTYTTAGKVFIK